jgi:hypothetical protein
VLLLVLVLDFSPDYEDEEDLKSKNGGQLALPAV